MKLLKALNWTLSRIIILVTLIVLTLSGYVLWSNYRTYEDVRDVYENLIQVKPNEDSDVKSGFNELK